MFRSALLSTALILAAGAALAVGDEDDTPPRPTETTTQCPEGAVWDGGRNACVIIRDSRLSPETLMQNARELAYAGRHDDAIALLALADSQEDSMVQTYLGFSHRSAGRMAEGLAHYERALNLDPDNLLARSYLGMAYVQMGATRDARVQLEEIEARGGTGRWPHEALAAAIRTGTTAGYDY